MMQSVSVCVRNPIKIALLLTCTRIWAGLRMPGVIHLCSESLCIKSHILERLADHYLLQFCYVELFFLVKHDIGLRKFYCIVLYTDIHWFEEYCLFVKTIRLLKAHICAWLSGPCVSLYLHGGNARLIKNDCFEKGIITTATYICEERREEYCWCTSSCM